jgi:methionyl-tRNA formyltransferase
MGILKKNDYIKILNYYNIPITPTDSSKTIKHKAEEILADKLCKCIKKVKKTDDETDGDTPSEAEGKAIGICSDSIFRRKGLKHSGFTCKRRPKFIKYPGKTYSLQTRSKYLSKKQKMRRIFLTRKNRS